jgi:Pyruvate/2-oxoacid:ferredoxin oxidoreductase delta subunit
VAWQDVTCGNKIVGCGTTKQFITGDWTNVAPVIDEEKCKQCLLCVPVCPDSAIPVKNGIPILIVIANSIVSTKMTGSANDLNVKATMIKIIMTDNTLTIAKSVFVVVIKSRVILPSPPIIPFLSYL